MKKNNFVNDNENLSKTRKKMERKTKHYNISTFLCKFYYDARSTHTIC